MDSRRRSPEGDGAISTGRDLSLRGGWGGEKGATLVVLGWGVTSFHCLAVSILLVLVLLVCVGMEWGHCGVEGGRSCCFNPGRWLVVVRFSRGKAGTWQ